MTGIVRRMGLTIAMLGAMAGAAGQAEGAFVPSLFGTGLLANGTVAAGGSADLHYTLILVPAGSGLGPSVFVESSMPAGYVANTSTSQWITPTPTGNGTTVIPAGSFDYQTTFNLTGFLPSTAVLTRAKDRAR